MDETVAVSLSSCAFSAAVVGTVLLSFYVEIVVNDGTVEYYAANYGFTP